MLTADFDFTLPAELIAQTPATPRDSSRLMVVDKKNKTIKHKHFRDIIEFLRPGDLVVWNNSKVFKARLKGRVLLDESSDNIPDARERALHATDRVLNVKEIEVFLVRPVENPGVWRVLAKPARKLHLGMRLEFGPDFKAEVMLKEADGTILMQFEDDDTLVRQKANMYGSVPTPPYISSLMKGTQSAEVEAQYQTVYAKREGSVAAPTAGFHFTAELIKKLEATGVAFAEVTLHVGLGTFLPVKDEQIEHHRMHSEWVEVLAKNADAINTAKQEGRRVIAVGTTAVRTLEAVAQLNNGVVAPYAGDVTIFIYPGYTFKVVDALITNFHLPKSTLIMLVAAFVGDRFSGRSLGEGRQFVLQCYEEAIKQKYRFYSFGDAMFIS